MTSGDWVGVKGALAAESSHAVSREIETVGVVNETIETCIGQGRVTDDFVPLIDRNLAHDDGGAASVVRLVVGS